MGSGKGKGKWKNLLKMLSNPVSCGWYRIFGPQIPSQNACSVLLAGDCVIASSFVSYLGPFNKEFRELLFTRDFQASARKLNISASPQLSVTTFLADQPEIGQWTLQVRLASSVVGRLLLYDLCRINAWRCLMHWESWLFVVCYMMLFSLNFLCYCMTFTHLSCP